MITKDDEMLCHQIDSTFDHVGTSDPKWTERTAIITGSISGELSLMIGISRYPNRNIMDGYGVVTVDNKTAHIVRVSRELRPETSDLRVGPLYYEVVEPLKRVRTGISENEYGLSFEIEFAGTFPCWEGFEFFTRSRGRMVTNRRCYLQVGKISGWLKIDGKTYEVNKEGWPAFRDHSWGVRQGFGGGSWPEPYAQPEEVQPGMLYFSGFFDFGKYMITFAVFEDWEGKPYRFEGWEFYPYGSEKEGKPLTFVSLEHDLQFRSDIRVIKSGRVILNAVDGSKRELLLRPLSTTYPNPAGYDLYNGYCSGMWKGPSFIDGFKLDVTDPDVLRQIGSLTETVFEARCGDDVGYSGTVETVCFGKYPRYGFQG